MRQNDEHDIAHDLDAASAIRDLGASRDSLFGWLQRRTVVVVNPESAVEFCLSSRQPGNQRGILAVLGNQLLEPENGGKPVAARFGLLGLLEGPHSQAVLAALGRLLLEPQPHGAVLFTGRGQDLVALQETVSLHDGRLRELELTPATASLVLVIDGSDGCGVLRRFTLRYSGVSSLRSVADPDMGLRGPHGYGDFGYDEVDVTPTSEFEHRILFSSGIELIVLFADVRLAWEDTNEPRGASDGNGLHETS